MRQIQNVEDAKDERESDGEERVDAADEDRVVELFEHLIRESDRRGLEQAAQQSAAGGTGSGLTARCAGAPGPRPRVHTRADPWRRGTGRLRESGRAAPRARTRGTAGGCSGACSVAGGDE